MNSSVDFFESLIDEDGRFAELNSQEPQWGYRSRPQPLPQGMIQLHSLSMLSSYEELVHTNIQYIIYPGNFLISIYE